MNRYRAHTLTHKDRDYNDGVAAWQADCGSRIVITGGGLLPTRRLRPSLPTSLPSRAMPTSSQKIRIHTCVLAAQAGSLTSHTGSHIYHATSLICGTISPRLGFASVRSASDSASDSAPHDHAPTSWSSVESSTALVMRSSASPSSRLPSCPPLRVQTLNERDAISSLPITA